ncbi:uncharacterized protein A1O9_00535 [Exophiala aquamarina CBS 119918]|uniref:3-oxoacyl-[acyl-carrier protein] reductase n=1 Tax=Exophiala aquamarina CBS 119918 TaxID=1182545 RepID=A0A072PS12_9EURO|nr:uncharacterized protein A1O9_00535 [Exophiala aquamarina CBS 119918]KEF62562.1 hypothetical protein A1O9_00535 [Exophiala aquamarina CBS 119918]
MATNIRTNNAKSVYERIDAAGAMQGSASGKVVLVTGAGRGQAISKAFTQAGADALILTALEDSELEETKQQIRAINPQCRVFMRALDVRDTTAVSSFIEDAAKWSENRVDVLCCNAGISPPLQPISESDPRRWWMGLEVNLKGPYLFARFVLPLMQKQKSGHIIITASRAAVSNDPEMSSYQISKLAVTRLAELIDVENSHLGIKSFAIHPGGIITRLLTDLETKETEPWAAKAAPFIRSKLVEDISLPGNSCVFLASGKADYLSGRFVDTTIHFDDLGRGEAAILEHDLLKIRVPLNWNPEGGVSCFSTKA